MYNIGKNVYLRKHESGIFSWKIYSELTVAVIGAGGINTLQNQILRDYPKEQLRDYPKEQDV